ncbi:MAG: hypothetical protein COT89_01625 [Candidatus Colwellbacteria bacterium CG10_big_fil_rev_8_21_14_0_10_42_22]|uniref:Uncharacterized protein n=1 Tax=Candidatus Colwellbacteria bacterium CG10_big_fil_rev_8_21_14_0_10_42_22 TaxID=1974540 RepID=A0A2H0VFU5_9BACT|nr:MAG: hypothetical protein COT89_01625 [Candidatus Colwellbacteria bacterium CG10_big_fil_rev_8_21_14_0_10_42_22]
MTQRVAIINDGQWGRMERNRGDYDVLTKALVKKLSKATNAHGEPEGEVQTFESTTEAMQWLQGGTRTGIVIFTTRGMVDVAKRLAVENPRLLVFLFTGLIPEAEVVFVSNDIIHQDEVLTDLVFHSH